MDQIYLVTLFASITILLCSQYAAVDAASKCEVCETVVQRFIDDLSSEVKSSPEKIENKFKKYCKGLKGKEHRFCYYIGGLPDSATYILAEMSKPISWSMPADKVCDKLRKKDPQICDLEYDKTIDFKTIDLKKLKVKDLKKILSGWGEECKGCAEKNDFVKLINELKPKYVKEEL